MKAMRNCALHLSILQQQSKTSGELPMAGIKASTKLVLEEKEKEKKGGREQKNLVWKFEKKEDLKPPASNKKEKTQPTTNLGKFQRKETCKKATENYASLRQTPLEGRRGDIIWGGFRAGCAVLKKIGLLFWSRRSK